MSGTLRDALAGHLARQPDRTFLIAPETGRKLSYRELDYQARLLARWLRAAGYAVVVARGDQVPKVVGIKSSFDFLVLLNVFNLFLGVPIDILTGAWMDLGPEKITVRFSK